MDLTDITKKELDKYRITTPSFHFYPGDCLRDISSLPESIHAAYLKLLCSHMKFLYYTRDDIGLMCKLDSAETELLIRHLHPTADGDAFFIFWAVDSILKYYNYCKSRSKNRKGKKKESKPISKAPADQSTPPALKPDDAVKETLNPDNVINYPFIGKARVYMESRGHEWTEKDFKHAGSIERKIKTYIRAQNNINGNYKIETAEDVYDLFIEIVISDNWHVKNNFSMETIDYQFSKIITALKPPAAVSKSKNRYTDIDAVNS